MGAEELLSQLTSSAMVIYALQMIKKSSWFPWLTAETKTLNRVVGFLGAGLTAVGIHFAFDVQAGVFVISGLTAAGLLHGAWHWAQQYALQQLAYDAAVAQKGAPA